MSRMNYPAAESFAGQILHTKGPGPLAEVDELLQATIPVDRSSPFEQWAPQGIRPAWQRRTQAAVAAQYSYVVLYNGGAVVPPAPVPTPTDDTLVVVQRVESDANMVMGIARFPAATWMTWPGIVGSTQGYPRDARYPSLARSFLISGSDAAVDLNALCEAGTNFMSARFHGSAQGLLSDWIVLPPLWGLVMRREVVNSPLVVSVGWVERSLL